MDRAKQTILSAALISVSFLGCVQKPDCGDASYIVYDVCVIEPPMMSDCFESILTQVHAAMGLDLEWFAGRDYAVTWVPQHLDEEDGATLKYGDRLWTEIKPGLTEYRIAQVLVHEFLHVIDYRLHGKFDTDPKTMHDTPGYFRVESGKDSLESTIYAGLNRSCL